jgi:hypothetical protein
MTLDVVLHTRIGSQLLLQHADRLAQKLQGDVPEGPGSRVNCFTLLILHCRLIVAEAH